MSHAEFQSSTRTFPRHSRTYAAALTATTSTQIAYTAIVGADGKRVGDNRMVGIQCSVKTHIKALDATGEDTADTNDFFLDAGEIWEGYLRGGYGLVYYATGAGRINIWETTS